MNIQAVNGCLSFQPLSSGLSVSYLEIKSALVEQQTMCLVSDTLNICQNLGEITSEKVIIKTGIKQHSSHPAWKDGSLWVREAELLLLLLLLWFVFQHRGHATVSWLSFGKSQQSMAPESCDTNRIERKYFVNCWTWPYVAIRCAGIKKTRTRKLCV